MIPDWQTNCVFFSRLLPDRHPTIWSRLSAILRGHGVPVRLLDATRDIWARDFCPLQATNTSFLKFRFRPDYLRGRYRRLITGNEVCEQMKDLGDFMFSGIVLDGGNVVASRDTIIVTCKLFRENPRQEVMKVRSELAHLLQVRQCIVISAEPGDPIGHSDGVVRFLGDNTAVINDYSRVDPAYGKRLERTLKKHGLQVATIPHFREPRIIDGIPSAVGNYANFLRVGNLLLVPTYGHQKDDHACATLQRLCPEAEVIPVECTALAREGGVLNCVAWPILSQE
jgi:agmatine deiminase